MSIASNWPFLAQQQLRGCPENVAAQEVRVALRHVCLETDCWQIPVVIRPPHFGLPELGLPCSLLKVVSVEPPHLFNHFAIHGGKLVHPHHFHPVLDKPVALNISLLPNETGNVLNELPDEVAQQIERMVICLAVANLSATQRKPWGDPNLSQQRRYEYQKELGSYLYNHNDLNRFYVIGNIDE